MLISHRWTSCAAALVLLALCTAPAVAQDKTPVYRSPIDCAYSPDGKLLALADRTAGSIVLIDAASGAIVRQAPLGGPVYAVAWSADSTKLYASLSDTAAVAEVNAADGKVIRTLAAGHYPVGVALAAKGQRLLVANSGLSDLSVIDLASGKELGKAKMVHEPFWIAVTPDQSMAVVSNLLPAGSAADPQVTAAVSLVDLNSLKTVAEIKLPPNTTSIRQTAISPDGKWAYAVHTVGRTTLPATQLERGWVNTNALSIIDLAAKKLYATVLLDNLSEGAADPWGVILSKDGATMWVTLAGVHQLARVELANLHKFLDGKPPEVVVDGRTVKLPPSIWDQIKTDATKREELVNDLSALYVGRLINRIPLPGKAPRGIALRPDGQQIAVAMYYTSQVLLLDSATGKIAKTIDLADKSQAVDLTRAGEQIFHDATYSFQHWLSCATCHPNDGRTDGLNWDLPNDGIGNPKSAKSLLYAHRTPPVMWLGVRDSMESAAMAGFRFSAFQPKSSDTEAVQAYIRSLKAQPSPYLVNGQMTDKAKRGQVLFASAQTGCANCHSGELFTNGKMINVGTQGELDHKDQDSFVTPPLVELWRTAPYMHDGRSATLQEVLTIHNKDNRHGHTSTLTKEQVDELAEYLLSL